MVLLLNALAASPGLHQILHPDANHADHQCAVTMFAHGQVDASSVDFILPVPVLAEVSQPSAPVEIFTSFLEQLPAGRAPPQLPAI